MLKFQSSLTYLYFIFLANVIIKFFLFKFNKKWLKFFFKDLGLDIQDDLGRHEVGFVEDTTKNDINNGNGCRMKTTFRINKGMN